MTLTEDQRKEIRSEANAVVAFAVRNGQLENLHAGVVPSSTSGDFADVKVVTPSGEIPWNNLSRLSDDEMKSLMIDVSASLARLLLLRETDPSAYSVFLETYGRVYASRWDTTPPEIEDAQELVYLGRELDTMAPNKSA